MKKQKSYCFRSRCIYLFGINKDSLFCEYCMHRKDWLLVKKGYKYMKTITSGCELKNYILEEYHKYDVELSSLFFDVNVCMRESEILETYASIQKIINGDSVIQYETVLTDNSGNINIC